jgi:hypothetical protein
MLVVVGGSLFGAAGGSRLISIPSDLLALSFFLSFFLSDQRIIDSHVALESHFFFRRGVWFL